MVTVALPCEPLSERDQHSYPSWQISGEKACMETGPLLIAFDKDWGDKESAPNSLTRSLSQPMIISLFHCDPQRLHVPQLQTMESPPFSVNGWEALMGEYRKCVSSSGRINISYFLICSPTVFGRLWLFQMFHGTLRFSCSRGRSVITTYEG